MNVTLPNIFLNRRCSEGIRVILPSKVHMKAEVDIAKLWIDKCQAYLRPSCNKLAFGDFLKVDDIKVHKIWTVLTLDLWQLVGNIFQVNPFRLIVAKKG